MRRIQFRFQFAVLLLTLTTAAAGAILLRFHRPLPLTRGEILLDGPSAPIEILRDRYGIPHVRAASRADAIFGLGFVHAQDRLWQMDVQRRAAAGRLAEALGPDALPTDRFMRTVGFARAAREARASLDRETLDTIDAYVRGVNAFLAGTSGWRLPVEYALTGARPEPWTADDVIASLKLLAWAQGMNWREDLMRLRIAAKLGAARTAELIPGEFDGATVLPASAAALDQIARVIDRIVPRPPGTSAAADIPELKEGGSNAWVLGGARTATGRPILANDPHIPAQAPATWYLVHLTGGTLDVIGATFPGACAVVIGHNRRVAWGVTNAMADAQDLFVVPYQEPSTPIEEVIKVRGAADERLTVRLSASGPIISDVVGERGALALRWTGLDRDDDTVGAFIALNHAASGADVRAALSRIHAPVLGIVYADAGGEIGYAAAGSIPIRAAGSGAWTGQARAEASASAVNPASAFVVTANNAIGGAAPQMSTSFELPYRAERITGLIEAESALSIDDVGRMQQDVVSRQPGALAPLLFDAVEPRDARSAGALVMLKAWDGGMTAGSPAATLFKRYYDEAVEALLRDELGDDLWPAYRDAVAAPARAMHRFAKTGAGPWCDNIELPGEQSCGSALGGALSRAIDSIERDQGSHWQAWRWDAGNTVRFPHAPMDAVAWLRPIFSRELPRGGDAFTVNPSMRIRGQVLVASYRQIIDVGDWDNSRFVIPLGQSGHPLSAHYDDLLPLWNEGRYVPMAFSDGAVRAAAWTSLILRPRLPRPSSSADTPR